MLPLAPGANGQPPRPPTEESSWVTPAWTAASALACPVPRVSWKCTPTSVPGQARRTASSSCTTRIGVVVPIVSPRHSRSAPAVTARSEEHTSELQSRQYLVCRLLLEKKKDTKITSLN